MCEQLTQRKNEIISIAGVQEVTTVVGDVKSQVDDLFTPSQLSALALSLEKGDCPIKYTYITEDGSKAWSEIEKQRAESGGSYAEHDLLRDNIDTYLSEVGNPEELCFFDFGSGTGVTPTGMLSELNKRGIQTHYHGFDISENMLGIAQKNIEQIGNNCYFGSTVLDFESHNLSSTLADVRNQYLNIPVIGMMLGSTVGNFNSMDRVLSNIIEASRIKDRFIIGVERIDLGNPRRMEQMEKGYQSEVINRLMFSTLEYFGVQRGQGELAIGYNQNINSIEGFFHVNEDIELQVGDQSIHFSSGERIRLVQSKKVDESSFTKLLLDLDLRIASMRTNTDNTFIETMVGSKKY